MWTEPGRGMCWEQGIQGEGRGEVEGGSRGRSRRGGLGG